MKKLLYSGIKTIKQFQLKQRNQVNIQIHQNRQIE
jgi:hypothetical protein